MDVYESTVDIVLYLLLNWLNTCDKSMFLLRLLSVWLVVHIRLSLIFNILISLVKSWK